MNLKHLLKEKRSSIIKKWCDAALDTYPEQSQKFLRKQKDAIANPIGNTISQRLEAIYDKFLNDPESDEISLFLDDIIRVRAIQEFSPSQAVSFVFELKAIVREELKAEVGQEGIPEELVSFESEIDGLAMRCFDIYTRCREKIAEIRVNELRNQSARLLKMAGLVCEISDKPGDLESDQVNNG
ncbi:MAG: RsbRD N-terminal domain-containing protein [Deltaproteobacteria bacterium]|nr:RsbRD N-terminal domain-containing protein [Deltaproteobacteria bacterium]MBW2171124.1 RsbRD N-terminal domain-containing protein [Deltaproteobacteria bacterium]